MLNSILNHYLGIQKGQIGLQLEQATLVHQTVEWACFAFQNAFPQVNNRLNYQMRRVWNSFCSDPYKYFYLCKRFVGLNEILMTYMLHVKYNDTSFAHRRLNWSYTCIFMAFPIIITLIAAQYFPTNELQYRFHVCFQSSLPSCRF